MPYIIEFTNSAAKDFSKTRDRQLKEKIGVALEELANNPLSGKPLQGELKSCYSYRIGDHRVVYTFSAKRNTLSVLKISHRKNVYKI